MSWRKEKCTNGEKPNPNCQLIYKDSALPTKWNDMDDMPEARTKTAFYPYLYNSRKALTCSATASAVSGSA